MPFGFLASCVVDQNPPPRFGRCREEMPSAIPVLGGLATSETQERLVNQRRGLQRLPRLLLGKSRCRQFAQLLINQRQLLLGSAGIALFDLGEDFRDVSHEHQNTAKGVGIPSV